VIRPVKYASDYLIGMLFNYTEKVILRQMDKITIMYTVTEREIVVYFKRVTL
jgi:hypothetical protein